jgi:hypothetical protein
MRISQNSIDYVVNKGHVEVEVEVYADERGPGSRSKIVLSLLSCIMQSLNAPFS